MRGFPYVRWLRLGRISLGVCLGSALAVFGAVSPAHALVLCNECFNSTCGFSFPETLSCREVPANEHIVLEVACEDSIPPEAYPQLVRANGDSIRGTWVRRIDERFVFEGAPLPAGENIRVMGAAPRQCDVLFEQVQDCSRRVSCPAESDNDCCQLYADSGLPFYEVENGEPILPTGEGGGGGGSGAPAELSHVYAEFRTTEPDLTAPPALTLKTECEDSGYSYVNASLFFEANSLSDVVRVEILSSVNEETPTSSVGIGISACSLEGKKTFNIGQFAPPNGDVELFARAYDSAGNFTDGPVHTLRVPDDCAPGPLEKFPTEIVADCVPATRIQGCTEAPELPPFESEVCRRSNDRYDDDSFDLDVDHEPQDDDAASSPVRTNSEDASGCGCRHAPARGGLSWFWFLGLGLIAQRRKFSKGKLQLSEQ